MWQEREDWAEKRCGNRNGSLLRPDDERAMFPQIFMTEKSRFFRVGEWRYDDFPIDLEYQIGVALH